MKLSFKYKLPGLDDKNSEILNDLMWHTEKIYNTLLYELKESKREINKNISINIIQTGIYKEYRENNWHSKYLHSHTMQQVIIRVVEDYKSYLKAKEDYFKNKSKYNGMPKAPGYKNDKKREVVFTKYAVRIENNKIKLSLSKEIKEKYQVESLNFLVANKLRRLVDFSSIKMIRISKTKEEYEMNIIYEKEEVTNENTNVMAIDLGLNNLVACTNLENSKALLVSGRNAKSKNKYIMSKISHMQKINKLSKDNKKKDKVKNTKYINRLYEYRQNYMNTYMHKVSKMVIDYAVENKCKTLVIGDIRNIKVGMNNNDSFVHMSVLSLVSKIQYKANLLGIEVKMEKESYTSGVSFLDNEEVIKENYNKKRRIKRGVFVTNTNKMINADINGSLNILRKYINKSSPNLEIAMDNGREQRPLKRNVA